LQDFAASVADDAYAVAPAVVYGHQPRVIPEINSHV
jgi:hypothetical protein